MREGFPPSYDRLGSKAPRTIPATRQPKFALRRKRTSDSVSVSQFVPLALMHYSITSSAR